MLSEFPKNRHNKSGRHSYCRKCSVRRANESRMKNKPRYDALRAIREAKRKKRAEHEAQQKLSITERVYQEVIRGNATREGIQEATGFHEDVVSDALANLYDADLVRPIGPRFYPRAKAA